MSARRARGRAIIRTPSLYARSDGPTRQRILCRGHARVPNQHAAEAVVHPADTILIMPMRRTRNVVFSVLIIVLMVMIGQLLARRSPTVGSHSPATSTASLGTAIVPSAAVRQIPSRPDLIPRVPVPDAAEPLPPLVFVRQGNLWRSDGSSAALRQLTQVDGYLSSAGAPVFSPDGSKIAYVVSKPPKAEAAIPRPSAALFIMNTDGTGQRAIWEPEQALLWQPAWTPDGQAIYVASDEWRTTPGKNESVHSTQLLRVDLATGSATSVLPNALSATPSGDGRWLAYVRRVDGYKTQLEIAATDGSSARTLIPADLFIEIYAPRFAPNGAQVLFTAVGGPATNPDGTRAETTTGSPIAGLLDFLAPATAEAHGEAYDLWTINTDGTGLRRLTWLLMDAPIAAFSPDGAEIIIICGTGLYRMNADGSRLRRLDPLGNHGGGIDWGAAAN